MWSNGLEIAAKVPRARGLGVAADDEDEAIHQPRSKYIATAWVDIRRVSKARLPSAEFPSAESTIERDRMETLLKKKSSTVVERPKGKRPKLGQQFEIAADDCLAGTTEEKRKAEKGAKKKSAPLAVLSPNVQRTKCSKKKVSSRTFLLCCIKEGFVASSLFFNFLLAMFRRKCIPVQHPRTKSTAIRKSANRRRIR